MIEICGQVYRNFKTITENFEEFYKNFEENTRSYHKFKITVDNFFFKFITLRKILYKRGRDLKEIRKKMLDNLEKKKIF